jgi:hypothetical protein
VSGGRHVALADLPLFAPVAQVAFSAWFRSAATDSSGGDIASMGDNYGLRLRDDGSLYFFLVDDSIWDPGENIDAGSWRLCILEGPSLVDDRWHHAAAVYDGAFMRIYLDGAEAARFPYSGGIVYPFKGGFQIGRHGFGSHDKDFRGGLDEFRFSRRAWSAGLVKAEYENQKPGSILLRFE